MQIEGIFACDKDTTVIEDVQDSLPGYYPRLVQEDTVVVNQIEVVNHQMETVLKNTTKFLKNSLTFAVVFERNKSKLYIKVLEGLCVEDLFKHKNNRAAGMLTKESEIYGYLQYRGCNFYVIVYPPWDEVKNDINIFFKKTDKRKIIKEEKKEEGIFIFYENPMWFYQYKKNKIVLLKAINDRGFFSHPRK